MKDKLKYFLVVFFLVLVAACKRVSVPSDVLPPDEMGKVLVDLQLAEAEISTKTNPEAVRTTSSDLYKYLYTKHHTDSITLVRSFDYYTDHADMLDEIYQGVIEDLSQMQAEEVH